MNKLVIPTTKYSSSYDFEEQRFPSVCRLHSESVTHFDQLNNFVVTVPTVKIIYEKLMHNLKVQLIVRLFDTQTKKYWNWTKKGITVKVYFECNL